jgi:uncharacterized protein
MSTVREINENPDVFVGVTLPIEYGHTGHFKQSGTIKEQAYSNIKNVVLTGKGERVGQPEFGCDVNRIIFDPITEDTSDIIEESVRDAISVWLPYISIHNVFVSFSEHDNNKIILSIEYTVDVEDPDSVESISFNFNVGI